MRSDVKNSISFKLAIFMVAIFVADLFLPLDFIRQFGVSVVSPYYTYLTYAFVHADVLHIGMNMLALLYLGPIIERMMSPRNFVLFSLAAALASGLFAVYMAQLLGTRALLVGYSGVLFAYIGVMFRVEIAMAKDKLAAIFDFLMRNVFLVIFMILPFVVDIAISGEAHLLGFFFGLWAAPYFLGIKRRR